MPIDATKNATKAETTDVYRNDIFKGKVALVTGGGSGICRGMAEALARHGASVVICGRTLSKLEEAAAGIVKRTGSPCLPVAADVRNFAQVEAAFKAGFDKFGRIDFVVCGAAGNFLARIEDLSPNAFKTVVEIDLIGTFHTCKAALPYLKQSKGAIINVTATLQYAGTPLVAHASAAKAGVDSLTKSMAVEFGKYGIRVNGIAPGPIDDTVGMSKLMVDSLREASIMAVPLESYGTVKDIEHATVYLFSEGANVSGAILVVDGGHWMTALTMPSDVNTAELAKVRARTEKRPGALGKL
ncbi:hypothetical protein HDV05_005004 [Chytridiales sp. JEL 0842]|nr:hypothetical protein HDV05_005004 [Chytridiales sp. JEL 0842]